MTQNVVPVVMGYGRYNGDVAPPHSVINVADFATPKELAQYLLWLDENPEEYLSYFWWHDYYKVLRQHEMRIQIVCDICRKLHTETETLIQDNLYNWWVREANCRSWMDNPQLFK